VPDEERTYFVQTNFRTTESTALEKLAGNLQIYPQYPTYIECIRRQRAVYKLPTAETDVTLFLNLRQVVGRREARDRIPG